MKISEAVDAAKRGDEKGYQYLYESTYSEHFCLARKYLYRDMDAINDVLQESYIKAFSNLNQLEDSEQFSKWFSTIVKRTALNELRKKKLILFSQMVDEEETIDFGNNFEREQICEQPEVYIDEAETKRLLKEMMDALSDEQRVCLLMYYFEELSIKEISEELSVSENTVKSRLNYGRKNLKEKVLELEKKGTKLYSMLPIPFFLYLLKTDTKVCKVAVPAGEFNEILESVLSTKGNVALAAKPGVAKIAASETAKSIELGSIKVKVAAGVLAAGVAIGSAVGVSKIITRENALGVESVAAEALPENMTVEQPVWESYECKPEVAAFGNDILGSGTVINIKMNSNEELKTDIPALPICFLENPKVQIDDKVFSIDQTTLNQVIEAYTDDLRYSVVLLDGSGTEIISGNTEIKGNMKIMLNKYGEQYAYLQFVGDENLSTYSLDSVCLQSVEPAGGMNTSSQNIWYQGGFRADGGNLKCSELEEIFLQKGIHLITEEQIPDGLPCGVSIEMRQAGLANIIEKSEGSYLCYVYIVYDAPEEFRLKDYHYSFNYDQNSQLITEIKFVYDKRSLYPFQKFHVDGKNAYTAQYLECGDYQTVLTKEQQENEVVVYGELCKMEYGIEDDVEESVLDVVGENLLDYSGKLEIKTNNGDGTYLCSDGKTDYILTVSDDAQMYLTSFSKSADDNYQILVPGTAFKQLPFGYETAYEGSTLYDFAGEFWGEAVVENGKITYFNEDFRQ